MIIIAWKTGGRSKTLITKDKRFHSHFYGAVYIYLIFFFVRFLHSELNVQKMADDAGIHHLNETYRNFFFHNAEITYTQFALCKCSGLGTTVAEPTSQPTKQKEHI